MARESDHVHDWEGANGSLASQAARDAKPRYWEPIPDEQLAEDTPINASMIAKGMGGATDDDDSEDDDLQPVGSRSRTNITDAEIDQLKTALKAWIARKHVDGEAAMTNTERNEIDAVLRKLVGAGYLDDPEKSVAEDFDWNEVEEVIGELDALGQIERQRQTAVGKAAEPFMRIVRDTTEQSRALQYIGSELGIPLPPTRSVPLTTKQASDVQAMQEAARKLARVSNLSDSFPEAVAEAVRASHRNRNFVMSIESYVNSPNGLPAGKTDFLTTNVDSAHNGAKNIAQLFRQFGWQPPKW